MFMRPPCRNSPTPGAQQAASAWHGGRSGPQLCPQRSTRFARAPSRPSWPALVSRPWRSRSSGWRGPISRSESRPRSSARKRPTCTPARRIRPGRCRHPGPCRRTGQPEAGHGGTQPQAHTGQTGRYAHLSGDTGRLPGFYLPVPHSRLITICGNKATRCSVNPAVARIACSILPAARGRHPSVMQCDARPTGARRGRFPRRRRQSRSFRP